MKILLGGVGPFQHNFAEDVTFIQSLLNQHGHVTGVWLKEDGYCGDETLAAICAFQRKVLVMQLPDQVVSNHGITLAKLQVSSIKSTLAGPPVPAASTPLSSTLTDDDYKKAADTLGCEVAAIKAVATQESPRGPFDSKGRPAILYERHHFSRLTRHVYDETHRDISCRVAYGKKGQPAYGSYDSQFTRLDSAYKLNQDAALMATSWGAFQILGENYKEAGFASVQAFVAAMKSSVGDHLNAFVHLVNGNQRLKTAIQKKDWATFASIYNGPSYKERHYDISIAKAYAELTKPNPVAAPQ